MKRADQNESAWMAVDVWSTAGVTLLKMNVHDSTMRLIADQNTKNTSHVCSKHLGSF